MRTLQKIMLPGLVASLATLASGAFAQVDVEPPMPNVMIMLDTSGSMMRRMSDNGSNPSWIADMKNECNQAPGANEAVLNDVRWFAVVQALTGNIPTASINCSTIDRTGGTFTSRYGGDVPDLGYYIPFFQLESDTCGLIPNPAFVTWSDPLAQNWFDYPDAPSAIIPYDVDAGNVGTCGTSGFVQAPDGVIDTFKRRVRFGLMTFDPLVDPQVGLDGDLANLVEGGDGTWSYWSNAAAGNDWYSGNGSAKGRPPACGAIQDMEVGARGPAAPPWEGRLMGFGYEKATSQEVSEANERVEQIIGAVRPYGATPLAGMMSDLYDVLLHEERVLPGLTGGPVRPIGAKMQMSWDSAVGDHLWKEGDDAGCRPFHVILITDGEPNLDLRPDCEQPDPGGDAALHGECPFAPIVDSPDGQFDGGIDVRDPIVNKLNQENKVIFHVVGLSVGMVDDPDDGVPALVSCTDDRYSSAGGGRCAAATRTDQEKVCCLLNAIQYEGNGQSSSQRTAQFAASKSELLLSLNLVLNEIASGTATRTTPIFQAVGPNFYVSDPTNAGAVGHELNAALETVVGDGLWSGRLERARVMCEEPTPGDPPVAVLQPVNAAFGDDFADNLKKRVDERFMYTVVPDGVESWRSIRPELTSNLDSSSAGFPSIKAPIAEAASTWADDDDIAAAMEIDPSKCKSLYGSAVTDDVCAKYVMEWYTGQTPAAGPVRSNPLGAIYHSQPVIVGPPREFARDEAYDAFATRYETRPTVVYAASVDGQLHAFLMADNTMRLGSDPLEYLPALHDVLQVDKGDASPAAGGVNNELWSFVPPIVLPSIQPYVDRHALLLDGGVTVRNLSKTRVAANAADSDDYLSNSEYRTYLVASSGRASQIEGGGYYFAMDVTDPHPDDPADFDATDDDNPVGAHPRLDSPKFLWQLSRADTGNINDARMFGDALPAAAITTIAYAKDVGDTPVEVPVAILAGGLTGAPTAGMDNAGYSVASVDDDGNQLYYGTTAPRSRTRYWAPGRADRSVTIVRLDTGEILYRFIGEVGDSTLGLPNDRLRIGNFHAPMSGTPVAYPGLVGQVSTRVFIGDADGILWALNLSSPNPDDWVQEIAWDAYHGVAVASVLDGTVTTGAIETVPVVSVDDDGDPVVLFATGNQEDFFRNVGKNFVVSISDKPGTAGYELNWELDLENTLLGLGGSAGQRVTGPLNLFDGIAYFATFVPNADACDVGESRIWGVKYLEESGGAPVAAIDLDGTAGIERYASQEGTIFGVAVNEQPSCKTGAETIKNDPIFGQYTTFTSSPPSSFELVAMSGRKAPLNSDSLGQSGIDARKNLIPVRIPLPTPAATVRVDSWAAIVE